MKKGIIRFYAFTLVIMSLGFCFGLYRNWDHQLKATKVTLAHDATLTSTFIDNALISTVKSLDSAKTEFTETLYSGVLDEPKEHLILADAMRDFMRFTATQVYGLLFFVNKQGQIYASSGEFPTRVIDFSDRFYYLDLRDHPNKIFTIGPIIKARTTGKYVFHMGVPILDSQGAFYGLLVQQLQIDDLCNLLGRNYNGLAENIVMHHPSQGVSFVYPTPEKHKIPIKTDVIAQVIAKSKFKDGCLLLDKGRIPILDAELVGFASSPTFGFVTSASMAMKTAIKIYLASNLLLMVYFAFSFVFVSYLFWRLYSQYTTLEKTHFVSQHDALTGLHNRWALNEDLPVLMHEAMRRQSPMSFLFIDIDHFKQINDNYNHETGDTALQKVAQALAGCLRRPLDFLCRWGGEEFVAILSDTAEDSAVMLAESMMEAVADIKIADINLTLSIGIKTATITMESIVHNHLNDAESAMMLVKTNGRAHYRIFGEDCGG
jgi:diguanylate cyclase (GGDEF)-like protein